MPLLVYLYSIGATYGSKFALWDLGKLNGGKPTMSGTSFTEGGNRFRFVCLRIYPIASIAFIPLIFLGAISHPPHAPS